MPTVLEASPSKLSSTTSNYYDNDWLKFLLDKETPSIKRPQLNFPALSMPMVEYLDVNWELVNSETSGSGMSIIKQPESDIVDDIESPRMPPKKKFRIHVRITSIKRGRPSICDAIES